MTLKRWTLLETKTIEQTQFAHIKKQSFDLGDGRIMPAYYSIDFLDWIQVFALTTDLRVILVKQYRPPTQHFFIETPGGACNIEDQDKPLNAALRELQEETGFSSDKLSHLGTVFPNPALQSNRLHVFLATDCIKKAAPSLDPFEAIEVVLVPFKDFLRDFDSGQFPHALANLVMRMALERLRSTSPHLWKS